MADDTAQATVTPDAAEASTESAVANLFASLRKGPVATDTPPEATEDVAPEEVTESDDTPEVETPEAAAPTAAQPFKLVLDGEDVDEAKVREWKQGHLRQDDYTRKTMALAEDRKKFEAETVPLKDQLVTQLTALKEALRASTPQEPNWDDHRKAVSPEQFLADFAMWQQRQNDLKRVEAAEQAAKAEQQERWGRAQAAQAEQAAARVFELLPEWKAEDKRQTQWKAIEDRILTPLGVKPEDVLSAARPELFAVLWKAAEYERLTAEAKTPPKVKVAPVATL